MKTFFFGFLLLLGMDGLGYVSHGNAFADNADNNEVDPIEFRFSIDRSQNSVSHVKVNPDNPTYFNINKEFLRNYPYLESILGDFYISRVEVELTSDRPITVFLKSNDEIFSAVNVINRINDRYVVEAYNYSPDDHLDNKLIIAPENNLKLDFTNYDSPKEIFLYLKRRVKNPDISSFFQSLQKENALRSEIFLGQDTLDREGPMWVTFYTNPLTLGNEVELTVLEGALFVKELRVKYQDQNKAGENFLPKNGDQPLSVLSGQKTFFHLNNGGMNPIEQVDVLVQKDPTQPHVQYQLSVKK